MLEMIHLLASDLQRLWIYFFTVCAGCLSCFTDSFLVGAVCSTSGSCGSDTQCVNQRCRLKKCRQEPCPEPYYTVCDPYETLHCQESGMECFFAENKDQMRQGFCADRCMPDSMVGDIAVCPPGPEGFTSTCIEVGEQPVCTIDCSKDQRCPSMMKCIPTALDFDLCFPQGLN